MAQKSPTRTRPSMIGIVPRPARPDVAGRAWAATPARSHERLKTYGQAARGLHAPSPAASTIPSPAASTLPSPVASGLLPVPLVVAGGRWHHAPPYRRRPLYAPRRRHRPPHTTAPTGSSLSRRRHQARPGKARVSRRANHASLARPHALRVVPGPRRGHSGRPGTTQLSHRAR